MLKYRLWRLRKTIKANTQTSLNSKRLGIEVEQKTTEIINLVGYVLLWLVLLDYGFILVSSQLFEPTWAYNTAGKLVETVWALLLSFLLIFYRRDRDLIKPIESKILSFLSWFILAIAIGYFLIVPIIAGNAFRIHRAQKAQIVSQTSLQSSQAKQYVQQLEKITPEQLNNLWQSYQQFSTSEATSIPEIKTNLLNLVKQEQAKAKQKLQTQFNLQKNNLIKTTVKWSLGAVISGVGFILLWKHTRWARMSNK